MKKIIYVKVKIVIEGNNIDADYVVENMDYNMEFKGDEGEIVDTEIVQITNFRN